MSPPLPAPAIGTRFGKLVVLSGPISGASRYGRVVEVRCDCGTERTVVISALTRGRASTCGDRRIHDWVTTHGQSSGRKGNRGRSGAYQSWASMIQRTTNPNCKAWARYAGRGIGVCDRWRVFANFYEDMGDRPEETSLDRIDNSEGYHPSNCRWATRSEQQLNRGDKRPCPNCGTMV